MINTWYLVYLIFFIEEVINQENQQLRNRLKEIDILIQNLTLEMEDFFEEGLSNSIEKLKVSSYQSQRREEDC